MDPFIGQIVMFGGNFAPRGWALCDGQLLPISGNEALFSILGTTYGGDGRTTFALPDLRGRFAMHPGNGPGLTSRILGQKAGSEIHSTVPSHSHTVQVPAASGEGESSQPNGRVPAAGEFPNLPYGPTPDTTMQGFQSDSAGSPSVNHMNPFQCVNFIIALQGIFPSRN